MFRFDLYADVLLYGFPRARGDVPFYKPPSNRTLSFSPRTRGCSGDGESTYWHAIVFPAHAGMFPTLPPRSRTLASFPRARGDVPRSALFAQVKPLFSPRTRGCSIICRGLAAHTSRFSPRTRGCSYAAQRLLVVRNVFPAHAGMFRVCYSAMEFKPCFPRARGDVPSRYRPSTIMRVVFPAHAGMFPRAPIMEILDRSFPRARGDVPNPAASNVSLKRFSPRTRGCSAGVCFAGQEAGVFPAHAGMFLGGQRGNGQLGGFPRARGDVPKFFARVVFVHVFSPRTRGCSVG